MVTVLIVAITLLAAGMVTAIARRVTNRYHFHDWGAWSDSSTAKRQTRRCNRLKTRYPDDSWW